MCFDLLKEFHPGSATALLPAIEACDQPETLRSWTLQCAKLRATRPSRRSSKRS